MTKQGVKTGVLIAFALGTAVSQVAHTAEQSDSTRENARVVGPATVTDPLERPARSKAKPAADAREEGVYQAKLKRCAGLGSPSEKQQCAEKASKERGQM